jgi:hypothetical protein
MFPFGLGTDVMGKGEETPSRRGKEGKRERGNHGLLLLFLLPYVIQPHDEKKRRRGGAKPD